MTQLSVFSPPQLGACWIFSSFVVHPVDKYMSALMNSMVLTSGEVTGLSQDRVSKQDAVAGKHKKQVVDDKLIPQ